MQEKEQIERERRKAKIKGISDENIRRQEKQ
jgi:hypothetical protein